MGVVTAFDASLIPETIPADNAKFPRRKPVVNSEDGIGDIPAIKAVIARHFGTTNLSSDTPPDWSAFAPDIKSGAAEFPERTQRRRKRSMLSSEERDVSPDRNCACSCNACLASGFRCSATSLWPWVHAKLSRREPRWSAGSRRLRWSRTTAVGASPRKPGTPRVELIRCPTVSLRGGCEAEPGR